MENTEKKKTEENKIVAPLRLQFKTLGAIRELGTRIVNSKVLTDEKNEQLAKLLDEVRDNWIKLNT